jgi:hypothetical protein
MKLYARVKIDGKWTYKAINTKDTNLSVLIAQEGWTWLE